MEKITIFYIVAAFGAFPATIISLIQCFLHIRNYTEPLFQRYILRILFMIPIYCIASYLSLVVTEWSLIFDTIRDCYEAWVIYNFLSLCFAYGGGPGEIVRQAQEKDLVVKSSFFYCTCCIPTMSVNGGFLRRVKQGTLQFVFVKPILAAIILVLNYGFDKYHEGNYNPKYGYLYCQIIYNICYTLALYSLLLFYIGTESLLAPFKPFLKFVMVKAVIFFTFWQGFLISCLDFGGALKNKTLNPKQLQSFLLCMEMLLSAILLLFAFSHRDYQYQVDATKRIQLQSRGQQSDAQTRLAERRKNVMHALNMGDLVTDTIHQFNPRYSQYVSYTDNEQINKVGGKSNNNKDLSQPPNQATMDGIQEGNEDRGFDILSGNVYNNGKDNSNNNNSSNQTDDIESNVKGVENRYSDQNSNGAVQSDRDSQLKNQYQMQRNQRPHKQSLGLNSLSPKSSTYMKQYKNTNHYDENKSLFG